MLSFRLRWRSGEGCGECSGGLCIPPFAGEQVVANGVPVGARRQFGQHGEPGRRIGRFRCRTDLAQAGGVTGRDRHEQIVEPQDRRPVDAATQKE
jgi:hypothetical protein